MTAVNPTGHHAKLGVTFWVGLAIGWAVIAYAVAGIIREQEGTNPPGLLRWFVVLVLAHDLVLAPIVAVTGVLLSRYLPGRARGPVLAALALSATLTLFAWPNVRGYGRRALNSSTLPWDYGSHLRSIIALIWVVALAVIVGRVVRARRAGDRASTSERDGPTR